MTTKALLSEEVKEKWKGVLEAEGVAPITDRNIRNTTTIVLENTARETMSEAANTSTAFGAAAPTDGTFNPVLISMIRRTMPSLIAHDLVGVQPMSMPTGLIFAMKSYYGGAGSNGGTATEAFALNAPDNTFTGDGTGAAATTAAGEVLGTNGQAGVTAAQAAGTAAFNAPVTGANPWPEMSFEIQKVSVEAKTRKLKAKYTLELAQDLKAIHGLDAEAELSNILSTEVIGEINRELVGTITSQAKVGAVGTAVAGTFNLAVLGDADGRWEMEKYKNLYMQIVKEATQIALDTRRGVGNTLIVSPLVAAALEQVTTLKNTLSDVPGSMNTQDFLGVTYAGVLGNRFKIFIDPYAVGNSVIVGYKGANVYDAGIYYAPYVGLQFLKTVGSDDFQPRVGIASRYGLTTNPFFTGAAGTNGYYRRFAVAGI